MHVRQNGQGFLPTQHGGHAGGPLGADEIVKVARIAAQHVFVEEDQRAKRLILRAGGHVGVGGQMAQKAGDLGRPHLPWVAQPVKWNPSTALPSTTLRAGRAGVEPGPVAGLRRGKLGTRSAELGAAEEARNDGACPIPGRGALGERALPRDDASETALSDETAAVAQARSDIWLLVTLHL